MWWCGSITYGVCTCALFGAVCRHTYILSFSAISFLSRARILSEATSSQTNKKEKIWFMSSKVERSEVSYGEVLGDKKVRCTLGWPYTEGTWLYCDYFIWCVSCTVVVLTGFVMCGCFGNMCTCIYCVLYCLYCVLYCFVYVYLFLFVLSVLV